MSITVAGATAPRCLVCDAACEATTDQRLFLHPDGLRCRVRVVNEMGASVDHQYRYDPVEDAIYEQEPNDDLFATWQTFPPIENVLTSVFKAAGVPRLGGTSGIEGWSSMSTFQRCPYLWARRYIPGFKPPADDQLALSQGDSPGLAVGTTYHTFLAVYYQRMIEPDFPLTPEAIFEGCRERSANPQHLEEAWNLFANYRLYYRLDRIEPLAVESLIVDPATRRSCRPDLMVWHQGDDFHTAGLYLVDHKSAQRQDDATLTGWSNDGGIIQQVEIFDRYWKDHPDAKELGPLKGIIVNIAFKTKTPAFYRAYVHPSAFQIAQHRNDLCVWQSIRSICVSTSSFPRARNGCITRYGKCSEWEHCVEGTG